MNKRQGFGLIRKTEKWLHRSSGEESVVLDKVNKASGITKLVVNGSTNLNYDDNSMFGFGEQVYMEDSAKIFYVNASTRNCSDCFSFFEQAIYSCDYGINFESDGVVFTDSFCGYADVYINELSFEQHFTIMMKLRFAEEIYGTYPMNIEIRYADGTVDPIYFTANGMEGYVHYVSKTAYLSVGINILPETMPYVKILKEGFGVMVGITGEDYIPAKKNSKRYKFELPVPLFSCSDGQDEYDIVSGHIIQRCNMQSVDKNTEFTVTEDGLFRIDLPIMADPKCKPTSFDMSFLSLNSLKERKRTGYALSEDGSALILLVNKNQSGADDFYNYFASRKISFIYSLAENIHFYVTPKKFDEGFDFFSILCDVAPSRVMAEYY